MNHSKIPSFCNSKFDPLSTEITRITENEINVGNTQTQDFDQYLFFKSSEMMINIHCSKPIISKTINFDHIWQLLFDDADYDTNTALYVITGGTRNSDASLIPKVISNIRDYTSVGKVADHPGQLPDLNMVHNANDGNGNNNDDGAIHPNAENEAASGGGGSGGSGGDGGGGSSGGGGGGGGNDELLMICRFSWGQLIETLHTQIAANHYESWERFGAAVLKFWLNQPGFIVEERHPDLCWPGCQPFFGRWDGENLIDLNWTRHEWQAVRAQINWLGVKPITPNLFYFARSLQVMGQPAALNGNGLRIYMYNELVQLIGFIETTIIPNTYNGWCRFAGAIYAFCLRRHGFHIAESSEHEVLPSNCWPGSAVSFGHVSPGYFTDIRWPHYLWQNVRRHINCVLIYALQQ